jgi:hypothetical protein
MEVGNFVSRGPQKPVDGAPTEGKVRILKYNKEWLF